MSDAMVEEEGAGANVQGAGSMTGSTQATSDANVNQDINTPEAYKRSVFNDSQVYAYNTKELTEKWGNFALENQRAWSQQVLAGAQRAQTMWENQQTEQMKDLAEIRARRLNQFDVALRDHWNKEEELQDDIATHATLQRIIDALKSAQGVDK